LGSRHVPGLLEQVPEGNIGQVNAYERVGVTPSQLFGDRAAPIATVRRESSVSECISHQRVPQVADAEDEARPGWFVGEPEPGEARHDDIECIGSIAAV